MANRVIARANCTACFGTELCNHVSERKLVKLTCYSIGPKDRQRGDAICQGYLYLRRNHTRVA